MRNHCQSIPDRSRPGLPTTASGVAQQDTSGNNATAKQSENESRKRGGRRVKKQREAWKGRCTLIRVGTLCSSARRTRQIVQARSPYQTAASLPQMISNNSLLISFSLSLSLSLSFLNFVLASATSVVSFFSSLAFENSLLT